MYEIKLDKLERRNRHFYNPKQIVRKQKNKITRIQLSYKRYERHFTQQENKQSSQVLMDIFQGGSYTRPLIKH